MRLLPCHICATLKNGSQTKCPCIRFRAIFEQRSWMAHLRRKRMPCAAIGGAETSRQIARADEAHQPRGRRFRTRRDREDVRRGEAQGTREVSRPGPCARICARLRGLTPKEGSLAERGCDEVPPTRHVQPREMPGTKADGARMAVQPRRARPRRQSRDCRAGRAQGGCPASHAPRRRPAFPADSQARQAGNTHTAGRHTASAKPSQAARRKHGNMLKYTA